ncbi:MAG: transporter substrate-binding protein [Burkholderiales bacterium]|jgi:putative ABC transport system substrate-binding protein|nr:transporter substrate-binding protein [Burkholderiales bacterium]
MSGWVRGLVVLCALAAFGVAAHAQLPKKVARVGVVSPGSPPPGPLESFHAGLRELGYVEGRNLQLEWRFAEGRNERLPGLIEDLVKAKVDVMFVVNTQAAQAAKSAAGSIPVVFARVSDPTRTGLVASLSRPGGNITGISNVADELGAKRIETLKTLIPGLAKVVVLWNSGNPGVALILSELQRASPTLRVEVQGVGVAGRSEFPAAFAAVRASKAGAMFVLDDLLMTSYRPEILAFAAEQKLPVMSLYEEFVANGGLLCYGPSIGEMYRRASWYVDRILRGAKAGDLPVEQPAAFELVINLKTAKALGLSVPGDVLTRANKVFR